MIQDVRHTRKYLTPRQVALAFGVRLEKVLAWIHSGELPALNLASETSKRPLWKVRPQDMDAFEERRLLNSRPKQEAPKRARKSALPKGIIEFYK